MRKYGLLLLLMFLPFSLQAAEKNNSTEKKLNFVIILADDLGWRDLSAAGSTFYESPHIDSIAKAGMQFRFGYANCQVCSPSRASIMTGKYTPRHGITDYIGARTGLKWKRNGKVLPSEYAPHLRHSEFTLAEAMKQGGYKTFFAGKWHLGNKKKASLPTDHGFDINKGGWRAGSPSGGYFSPFKNPQLKNMKPGESLPVRLGTETAKFIEDNKERPFFAYLSFYAVHSPVQTSQLKWKKFRKKAASQKKVASRFRIDRTLPVRQVQDNPVYAGLVESMDDGVGIVLNKLKELGLEENTVVIFTSDNGGVSSGDAFSTSNLPLRGGKGRQWEGGIREPFYVHVPGLTKPGSSCDTPVIGMDLYPTILALANVPQNKKHLIDGVSIVPLLKGKNIAQRDLFWHYPHYGNQGGEPSSIIRSGDWKLIHYWEDGRNELYHLKKDIGEKTNLANQMKQRTTELHAKLKRWLKETNAKIPQQDKRFSKKKWEQKKQDILNRLLPRLEKDHARFLDTNWKPNRNWWGSLITKD
ncbi:Arylsulfatase [hydrothermal vent metagenome]|uniref:Arylsulfatase n=1 Tax=hydrothermal vent metagenome TaxID=652676 RepID=A0A3B1DJZ3_9ZZZZ